MDVFADLLNELIFVALFLDFLTLFDELFLVTLMAKLILVILFDEFSAIFLTLLDDELFEEIF